MEHADPVPTRPMCWRCRWPQDLCWCSRIEPLDTRSRFVILMHPKEARHIKANTGRFTHLSVRNSYLFVGLDFTSHPEVQALASDPAYQPVLLYPSDQAVFIPGQERGSTWDPAAGPGVMEARSSTGRQGFSWEARGMGSRPLCVFVLDATWACAKSMYKCNTWFSTLIHLGIQPKGSSRYTIKRQPGEACLSTLEAVHEVLAALDEAGLDRYERPRMMLDLFEAMQDFQVRCAGESRRARTVGLRLPGMRPDLETGL